METILLILLGVVVVGIIYGICCDLRRAWLDSLRRKPPRAEEPWPHDEE